MSFDIVKEFLKTKKGKAAIVSIVGGGLLYFFPGSADMISGVLDFVSEISGDLSDKLALEGE